jgi:putative CocE/NonD family hydrolase
MHICRWRRAWAIGTAVLWIGGALWARDKETALPAASADMQWGTKIPVRDGVTLNATIYRPHGQKNPLPVVFTLTPYISDSYLERAFYFAAHGYVFALVDVRGRGNSGGSFEPFANDARDGYDIVEWLARQPWCNGKVAMWGGSYAGFDQWTTLKERPAHLSTIVPAAAAHPGTDFPFQYNIFAPYDMQWLTFTSGVTGNGNLFGSAAFWASKAREYYNSHSAFKDFDRLVGNPSPIFQKWLQHPRTDAYYDAMVPTPEQYKSIGVPILTITGHYDGDQPGALTYYNRHMRYGSAEAKQTHYLIIGPWDHAGTRTPKAEVGGLKFGAASLLDLNDLHREWYDWTMKSGAKPAFLKKRVAYYVMGADEWKYADSLEDVSPTRRTLLLASPGTAEVFRSGHLAEKPAQGPASDAWTYDPLDTRPGAAELDDDPAALTSQRLLMNLFGNGAVYHGDPLSEPTEISGAPKLILWLSMDVPDTDLEADLYEILPDGGSVFLSAATMRARYRESARQEKAVPIGKPEKYVFDNFTFFSRQLAKGSRLRLLIHCINSIVSEKNYNSGGAVAEETASSARTAHVTLLHDAEHPSALELPIGKP